MNGTRVKLTETQRNLVRHYATAALPFHKKFGRTDDEVWSNIRRGKEGEVAYCLVAGLPTDTLSFDTERRVDPGYDLEVGGVKVDVKTGTGDRVYFNPDYAGCDRYELMRYHHGTDEYEYLFGMGKYLALKLARTEGGLWFWDLGADFDSFARCGYIAGNKQ